MGVYESEARLENRMIDQLVKQGYEQIQTDDVNSLEENFREQVNKHNKIESKGKDLSDKEFERLMVKISGKGVFQSAKELRQKQDIQRDDGTIIYNELFNTKDLEKKVERNVKRNEKFISEFENWLNEKGLAKKTIRRHVNNASLYINDYLNYYDVIKMEEGVHYVHGFLDGWFIEKCLWSSKNSIKETAASIKKFYECMSEKEYLRQEEYKKLCREIKDNMDEYLEQMDALDNGTYYDIF